MFLKIFECLFPLVDIDKSGQKAKKDGTRPDEADGQGGHLPGAHVS